MSESYTIDELITGYYDKQFAEAASAPIPRFSFRHRRRMKKIFELFSQNKRRIAGSKLPENKSVEFPHKPLPLSKRLLIATVIIVFMVLLTGFVKVFVSESFKGTVYQDNTRLYAVNTGDCPSTIEREYSLSILPDGFEYYDKVSDDFSVSTYYINTSTGQEIVFDQTVKSEFASHINTEGYTLEETLVNGCDAVYIEFKRESGINSLIIWNNEDYILKLYGNFAKSEILNLAKSNEINGF